MSGYTKLFSSILTSAVWCGQDSDSKVVWITMLAMADRNGVVDATLPGLAKLAEVPVDKVQHVVDRLSQLDSVNSLLNGVKQRLEPLDRGWLLLNYKKYRNKRTYEARKEYMRKYMRDYMRKKRNGKNIVAVRPQVKQCLAQAEADIEYMDKKVYKGGCGGDFDLVKPVNPKPKTPIFRSPELRSQPIQCCMPGCGKPAPTGQLYCSDACRDYAQYLTSKHKGNSA